MPDKALSGSTLGFDFGLSRIGVAQGEALVGIAHPIMTIHEKNNATRFEAIQKLIEAWQPTQLVVGLPVHMDGQEHEMTQRCQRFARQLSGRFGLAVFLVDERLSSAIAEELLREAQVFGKKQKPFLDQVAAQAILYSFFENKEDPRLVTQLT